MLLLLDEKGRVTELKDKQREPNLERRGSERVTNNEEKIEETGKRARYS